MTVISRRSFISAASVHTRPGEWVRYSTPESDGAHYVAICLPAFTADTVHRATSDTVPR